MATTTRLFLARPSLLATPRAFYATRESVVYHDAQSKFVRKAPYDKVHFDRIVMYNKRYTPKQRRLMFGFLHQRLRRAVKSRRIVEAFPDLPRHTYGVRDVVVEHPSGRREFIEELAPQLVVPPDVDKDEETPLKPYVSYRTRDIQQEEFTAKDLFNAVYAKKIIKDFKEGKLDEDGRPLEPSPEEALTADDAYIAARKTGSDIFEGGAPRDKKYDVRWEW